MINSLSFNDGKRFYELGLLVNDNFEQLFNLNKIIESDYDYVYGYYDKDNLIGFVHITKLYETVDIVNIVVDSRYQRRGIGNALLDYVIHRFDDIESILLEVNEKNIPAINLYKKNSFYEISKRNNYYGSNAALIMKRDV